MEDLATRIIYKWQAGGKKPMLVSTPGCFTGDMLIMTPTGPTEIRKLKTGDVVYDGEGEHTTLANACVIDNDPKPMIYWTTNAGQKKGATYDHPFYDARTKRFYPLYQFIWRDLETRQRIQLELLCKQYGKTFDPYGLRGIQAEDYATSDGRKWLPTDTSRRENRENTQARSTNVYPESTAQDTCEPQELRQSGQQSRELGMDDSKRKPRLQLSRWTHTRPSEAESNELGEESETHTGNKRLCELLEQRIRENKTGGDNKEHTEKQTQARYNLSQIPGTPEAIEQKNGSKSERDNAYIRDTGHKNEQKNYTEELRICESKLRDIEIRESEPYYSIEIQGRNKTYIIEDGWIVHNCGKTAFVNYLANKLGVNIKAINTSTFEGVDANGMPYIDQQTHTLTISKPFWLEGLKDGDILFLDEFSNAPSEVRNAFLQIILDQKLPSGADMPHLRIIGAMNPASDLEGYVEFSNAMKDRWAFIPFDFPTDEWHKLYKDNFGKPQTDREQTIRAKLSKFLTTNPQLLENRKPLKASAYGITNESEATTVEYATPNRRNWDNLAREMAQTKDNEELKHMQKNMFMENVGLECWRNYKEYISTENKPLSTYKWDGEPDEISQQVARLRAETNVDKQAEYFVRAYKYCENKEVVSALLPDVLKNAISKYGIEYKMKLPVFYKIYAEIGA